MLSTRDFLDEDFYKWCQVEFEAIRQRRNAFKGIPDQYDRINMTIDKIWDHNLRVILADLPNKEKVRNGK